MTGNGRERRHAAGDARKRSVRGPAGSGFRGSFASHGIQGLRGGIAWIVAVTRRASVRAFGSRSLISGSPAEIEAVP